MTELEIFSYSGQQVRTVAIDGEPWFVAGDVCAVLDIANSRNAVARLDEDDVRQADVIDSLGRSQSTSVINESGLFELILRSDKPEAKKFRRWLTSEVLPSLRRTGQYGSPKLELDITNHDHLQLIITAGHAALTRAIDAEAKVAELEPAAEAWDSLAAPGDDFSVREAAQVLSRDELIGIGQNRLFGFLREIGWIDARNAPYQAQVDCGRLVRRITDYTDDFGQRFVKVQPRVTAKGIAELRKRLLPPESGLRAVPNLSA